MPDPTTIQVSREVAELLRKILPGKTYDEALRTVLSIQGSENVLSRRSESAGAEVQTKDTRVLDFVLKINPATKNELVARPNVGGLITAVAIFFPAGASGLVEVQITKISDKAREKIIPSREDSVIALDDELFFAQGLSIPIEDRDQIRVEWFNYDGGFAHTVPVYIFVTKV